MKKKISPFVTYLLALPPKEQKAELLRLVRQYVMAKTAAGLLDNIRTKISNYLETVSPTDGARRLFLSSKGEDIEVRGFTQYKTSVLFDNLSALLGEQQARALLLTPTITSLRAKAAKGTLLDKDGQTVSVAMLERVIVRMEHPDYELRVYVRNKLKDPVSQRIEIDDEGETEDQV